MSQYWELFGMKGAPPVGLTKDKLINYFWEGVYYPTARKMFAQSRDAFIKEVQSVVAKVAKLDERLINKSFFQRALDKHAESLLWDTAAISKDGLGVLGSQINDIRKLAILNGIPSATAAGKSTRQLLNIINKYLPEGVAKFSDEALIPYNVAQDAIKAWAAKEGSEFVPILEKITPIDRPTLSNLIPPITRRSDAAISPTRNMAEQMPGIRKLFDNLLNKLNETGGHKVMATTGDAKLDKAFDTWADIARPEELKVKLIADRVGTASRDFTVLPYSTGRTNLDTVLGVIYPYHFWHSRTYINWIKRISTNPGLIAAYAKYRDTMAEIHAGAPDWWKYNIRSDEMLGQQSDNPLFFNLEANFNPINSLTAVDFNDPYKRVNWWSSVIDDLGKFGPAPWTFLQWGTAVALQMTGEEEAAARWSGRLFPQTAALESLSVMAGFDHLSLDPAHWLVGGDPYLKDRARRALAAMVNEGIITNDQAIDASSTAQGEVWQEAMNRAVSERAPGQIASFFFGAAARARTISDMQADEFYSEFHTLLNSRDTISPDAFRMNMDALKQKYPFMDTLLVGKKTSDERDTALAYNVLNRLPPGGSKLVENAGLDSRLVDRFYASKGKWTDWTKSDRDRLMAGITDLRAILATPADSTRQEWTAVRVKYAQINTALKSQFGDDILDQIDAFYARYAEDSSYSPSETVSAALDYKQRIIANDRDLATYYGGIDAIAKYYEGLMYDDIETQMGDIWAKFEDGTITAHERKKYYAIKDSWQAQIDAHILKVGELMPNGAEIRPDAEITTAAQEDFIAALEPITLNESDVIDAIGFTSFEIVQDFLSGGTSLDYGTRNKLLDLAEQMGISYYELLQLLKQTPVYQP